MRKMMCDSVSFALGILLGFVPIMGEARAAHEIRPVLLVHGWNGSYESWDDTLVKSKLLAQGRTVYQADLPVDKVISIPLHIIVPGEPIETLAQYLWYLYLEGQGEVDIVAHSMGGLVSRQCLWDYDPGGNQIRSLVMFGTMNYGTVWAFFYFNTPEIEAMRPGSSFLNNLNQNYTVPSQVHLVSLIGSADEAVIPQWNAYLNFPAAEDCENCLIWSLPCDHSGLLYNKRAFQILMKALPNYSTSGASVAGVFSEDYTTYNFTVINENPLSWINQFEVVCNDSGAIINPHDGWTGTYDSGVIRWTCSDPHYYISPDEPNNTFSFVTDIVLPSLSWRLYVPGVEPISGLTSPPSCLKIGWNLMSIPIDPVDPCASEVLSDCIDAGGVIDNNLYRWNCDANSYEVYPEDFSDMGIGKGYWLKLSVEDAATIAGIVDENDMEITLSEGWNLIGHPFVYPVQLLACQVSDGIVTKSMQEAQDAGWILARVYFYDDNAYKIVNIAEPRDDDSLRPWYGYWILARQPGLTLIVPSDGGVMSARAEGGQETTNDLEASQVNGISELQIQLDANDCTSWDFHAGIEAGASDGNDQLDMPAPPLPPPGLTEVRLTSEVAPLGAQMYDYRPPPPTGSIKIWNATAYPVNFQGGSASRSQ